MSFELRIFCSGVFAIWPYIYYRTWEQIVVGLFFKVDEHLAIARSHACLSVMVSVILFCVILKLLIVIWIKKIFFFSHIEFCGIFQHLTNGIPRQLAILGAGVQARSHYHALSYLYKFQQVTNWKKRERNHNPLFHSFSKNEVDMAFLKLIKIDK